MNKYAKRTRDQLCSQKIINIFVVYHEYLLLVYDMKLWYNLLLHRHTHIRSTYFRLVLHSYTFTIKAYFSYYGLVKILPVFFSVLSHVQGSVSPYIRSYLI